MILLAAPLAVGSTRVSAQAKPALAIEWVAPAGCPDENSVRASIAALLGENATKRNEGLTFRATVTPSAGRFALEVRIRSASGEETKSLNADTCEMAADAFAVVAAIAIDPSAGNERNAPPILRAPATREPAIPATPFPSAAPTPAAEPLPWALGLFGAGSAGPLPFPGLGVGALAAVGGSPRWELALSYWPKRAASFVRASGSNGTVRVDLMKIQPSVCVPLSAQSLFEVCPGLELGRIAASGEGVSKEGSGAALWLAPTGGLASRLPLNDRITLRLRFDVGVPIFRRSFVIQSSPSGQVTEAWRPLQVLGILSFATEARVSPRIARPPGM